MLIGADLNGHIGEGSRDEEVMSRHCFKERNPEGQILLKGCKWLCLILISGRKRNNE